MKKIPRPKPKAPKSKTPKVPGTKAEVILAAFAKNHDRLNPREAEIIMKYYGFDGHMRHTLQEIANGYGITRERVRQIKHYATKKITDKEPI